MTSKTDLIINMLDDLIQRVARLEHALLDDDLEVEEDGGVKFTLIDTTKNDNIVEFPNE
jgi:hypothetical protein